GFLLSCKQAYKEGIDVLYAANRFYIRSEPLLLHIPQLIPTNRLASITSLSIAVTVVADEHRADDGHLNFNLNNLEAILASISTHFTALRSLHAGLRIKTDDNRKLGRPAMQMFDAFYRSMQLRHMRVKLPWKAFREVVRQLIFPCAVRLDHSLEEPDWRIESGPNMEWAWPRWRALDGDKPAIQFRTVESYPRPPLKLPQVDGEDARTESEGYWLLTGDEGPPLMS
ncbi:hypothetical protein M011DRAFT_390836, partial [Sporormia fimetaria CBS 119925]